MKRQAEEIEEQSEGLRSPESYLGELSPHVPTEEREHVALALSMGTEVLIEALKSRGYILIRAFASCSSCGKHFDGEVTMEGFGYGWAALCHDCF